MKHFLLCPGIAVVALLIPSAPGHTAAAAAVGAPPSAAQPVLSRLTIIAPAAPGGGWDQLAREMEREIVRQQLTGAVQVENVPGAAGTSAWRSSSAAGAATARRCWSTVS